MTTDNEAGKSRTDGQWDVPPLDHSELVQMRIRLIALETIVTGLLCDISPQQRAAIGNQTGGRVGFFLHTDDFAATHARMVEHGVRFAEEPRTEPYGTVAVFTDPFGNSWDLIEPR